MNKCCCGEVKELRQYKEDTAKLLAEMETDLVRVGILNRTLGVIIRGLAEENRKLKEGRDNA